MAGTRALAAFDLDGTLVRGNVVRHYLYFARTDASLSGRAWRLAGAAAKGPLWAAMARLDRRLFNEAFYRSYEGLSEDRLRGLSQECFDRVLKPAIFPGAKDLVEGEKRAGRLTVLLTGALDFVAEPLARHLGFDHVAANRLSFDAAGRATGELEPPVLAGPEKARWLRQLARERGIDLEASRAYSNDTEDLPLLSAVGHPIAVNPDRRLRATAEAHGWPALTLEPAREGPAARRPARVLDRAIDGALSVLRVLETRR